MGLIKNDLILSYPSLALKLCECNSSKTFVKGNRSTEAGKKNHSDINLGKQQLKQQNEDVFNRYDVTGVLTLFCHIEVLCCDAFSLETLWKFCAGVITRAGI